MASFLSTCIAYPIGHFRTGSWRLGLEEVRGVGRHIDSEIQDAQPSHEPFLQHGLHDDICLCRFTCIKFYLVYCGGSSCLVNEYKKSIARILLDLHSNWKL
jgi:hypothetical protein